MSTPAAPGPSASPESAKTATDVTIVAVLVVIAIILIVSVSAFLIIRFLRGVVSSGHEPPDECAEWRAARAARVHKAALASPRSPVGLGEDMPL